MSAASAKNSDKKDVPSGKTTKSMAILLFATAADTTWRMFVPTLGGSLIGLWIDDIAGTEPIFAVGGLVVGVVITILLVRQQYKQVEESHAE